MELYLFRSDEWEKFYNCNKINLTEIPFVERFHPLNGSIIIVLFIIFEFLYIPCIYSIYKHTEHSCYKLLFFIGIVDMIMLFIQGLETGVYNFTGGMFCYNINFNYITGSIAVALYAMETSANVFLALDRCLNLISPKLNEFLFDGKRIFFSFGFSIIFSLYYFFYVNPSLYNGLYMNWFFNPYQGYSIEASIDIEKYTNPITFWYNLFLTFCFPIIYLFYISSFIYRFKEIYSIADVTQRKWKITTFIQVAIICGLNIACCCLFSIMQRLPMSKTLILIGYYVNYFVFGFPPIIYLSLNKTIRTDCLLLFYKIFYKNKVQTINGKTILVKPAVVIVS
ncbi:hypothetical protein Mgra_00006855 [Meloidogyne graminicola]|uniref:Serpentine receptor class gamma n=1 Tax=Meloidogyne graminicola TaxID=189291 RepID=A0A8S9ZK76_9BILA|nr:hypothetical protein Mgra_00006855 [Meloidogyne graminicola]